jgi:hypothetical protein
MVGKCHFEGLANKKKDHIPALTYPMIPPAATVAAYAKLMKSMVIFHSPIILIL